MFSLPSHESLGCSEKKDKSRSPLLGSLGQSKSVPNIKFAWEERERKRESSFALSEADHRPPKAGHQKKGILSDALFLVRVTGLEPARSPTGT